MVTLQGTRLAIPDLRSGMSFLGRLPLANPSIAHPSLAEFIESLIESPPPFHVFVQLLEQCRLPLAQLQADIAKTFLGRAIPLGESEENVFQQVVRAWNRMARAYARCAQLDQGTDAEHAERVATILQRCLYYSGQAILAHFYVRRQLPHGLWLDFYGYYDSAEEWGIATNPVYEPLDKQRPSTHCAAELTAVLLTELAGPYSYPVRDIETIHSWARLWAASVSVLPISTKESTPHYSIDLLKDNGIRLTKLDAPSLGARRLDTSRLGVQLEKVKAQLDERMLPGTLGLGDVLTTHAKKLLNDLVPSWTQVASPRRFRRRPVQGLAQLATTFENIYYLIAKHDFVQPSSKSVYSRKEFELLYAFRHRVDQSHSLYLEQQSRDVPADTWHVLNQSANGFRLERRTVGQRIAHKQLLAIRPSDGKDFILAQAHWLMQERDGSLVAGVEILPGIPEAIAVRQLSNDTALLNTPYNIAFLLPETPSMQAPASLVIPKGCFQSSNMIEMYAAASWHVRLKEVLQSGEDFERISFTMTG